MINVQIENGIAIPIFCHPVFESQIHNHSQNPIDQLDSIEPEPPIRQSALDQKDLMNEDFPKHFLLPQKPEDILALD
jgi:hypothetical protein